MFFRKVTSRRNGKEYSYLKLIENYRVGNKVRQRVVANLGSLDNLTPERVQNLISGLSRICGLDYVDRPFLEARKVLRYGEVLAVHKVWEMLKVAPLVEQLLPDAGADLDVPLLLELMVLNQLIRPQNKQALSDWYRCLYLPGLEKKELLSRHFNRALACLTVTGKEVERRMLDNVRQLITIDTTTAFCRLTTACFEPAPHKKPPATAYGKYFMGTDEEKKQADFGIITTRDGVPFGHHILPAVPEQGKFKEIILSLKEQFGIDRCIFVGEHKVMANPQLELLLAHQYDYLIGQKLIDHHDRQFFVRELAAGRNDFNQLSDELWFKELKVNGVRYLLCFDPQKSLAQQQQGAFLLATNSALLSSNEAIQVYAALAELVETCQEVATLTLEEPMLFYNEPDVSAHVFVCVLAGMLAKVMEKMLHLAGVNLTYRQALGILEDIKLAIGYVGDREVRLVTQAQKIHGDIFRALGIKELPRVVV